MHLDLNAKTILKYIYLISLFVFITLLELLRI